MHRPEYSPTTAPGDRAADAAGVLPQHVLLRLMRDAGDDTDATLDVAAQIAASRALTPSPSASLEQCMRADQDEPEQTMDQDQSVSPDAAIDEADGRPDDRDDVLAAILVEDDDPDETADSAGEAAIEEVEAIAEPEAAPDGAPPDEDLMSNLFEDAGDAEAATTEADDVVTDDAAALFDEPVAEPDTEEPAADEPAAEEPAADEEPEAVVPEPVEVTANPSSPTADHGLEQVESVLGEMKTALVELAQRPQPEPASLDVSPLVQAVSEGFERSSQQHERTVSAIDALAGQMGRVEQAVLHASAAGGAAPAVVAAPTVAAPVAEGMSRQTLALGAIAMVVLAWSVVFWVKTGSPRVALGTLVGANAVACCLLLAQRDRR